MTPSLLLHRLPALSAALVVTLTLALTLMVLTAPAGRAASAPAATPTAVDLSFYETPVSLPARNGDLVRSQPANFFLDPLKAIRAPGTATRIMYRSTSRTGEPIAVTGTVLQPSKRWIGFGQRPLVAFAVGTQGLGDQCAPSRQLAAGSEYEGLFIKGLLARGYSVVVTDYEGLGTEGLHPYMSRQSQAHAVLDSLRAAQRADVGVVPNGPVGISGYSQGGGASAAAAEVAPSYAPELNIMGAVAGAVPADLISVAQQLDGSLYFSFLGYAMAGLSDSYGIDLDPVLNQRGDQLVDDLAGECTLESVVKHPFVRSSNLTVDQRSISQLITDEPFRTMINDQLIGNDRRPQVPVLVTHSLLDDVIPYRTGRNLARRWCDQGARVQLRSGVAPGHVGGLLESFPKSFSYLEARFRGRPATSSCWRI